MKFQNKWKKPKKDEDIWKCFRSKSQQEKEEKEEKKKQLEIGEWNESQKEESNEEEVSSSYIENLDVNSNSFNLIKVFTCINRKIKREIEDKKK